MGVSPEANTTDTTKNKDYFVQEQIVFNEEWSLVA